GLASKRMAGGVVSSGGSYPANPFNPTMSESLDTFQRIGRQSALNATYDQSFDPSFMPRGGGSSQFVDVALRAAERGVGWLADTLMTQPIQDLKTGYASLWSQADASRADLQAGNYGAALGGIVSFHASVHANSFNSRLLSGDHLGAMEVMFGLNLPGNAYGPRSALTGLANWLSPTAAARGQQTAPGADVAFDVATAFIGTSKTVGKSLLSGIGRRVSGYAG
ncbi:MAG: hypothetical protein KF686_21510, partial [Ramlibacter sp.]|nr:hypothetical protein [Ramlibacter sp.]